MANRNFNAQTLTAEALRRIGKAPDPRVRQVISSLTHHLHGFVREIKPTQEEWLQGIQFLTETGKWCDEKRQEWILFSDTMGVSIDRKSTRLNSSHIQKSRMPSSA